MMENQPWFEDELVPTRVTATFADGTVKEMTYVGSSGDTEIFLDDEGHIHYAKVAETKEAKMRTNKVYQTIVVEVEYKGQNEDEVSVLSAFGPSEEIIAANKREAKKIALAKFMKENMGNDIDYSIVEVLVSDPFVF